MERIVKKYVSVAEYSLKTLEEKRFGNYMNQTGSLKK